ncbi:uncharacterized protein PAF06_012681 [Gastrophryne carolinensis]
MAVYSATIRNINVNRINQQDFSTISKGNSSFLLNAWSRGAPSFSPGLHYTGQAFKRRNVVRFKNKGAKEDLPDRRHVIRELLCNQMGFTPADILAVINLPDRQGYDISFKLMSSLDRFWASVTKFRGAEGWDQFILIPVSKPGTVSVNILFWNESVPPQDIVIWLRRHCDMVSDLTKCLDDDGIWTGGWRVLVKLRQHSNVTLHLPNSFFIGRERGVCFYAGQPRLCFKCGKAGHVAGVCTVVKCNLCGEIGHTSAMCTNVRCNLCGQMGHYHKDCSEAFHNLYSQTAEEKLYVRGNMKWLCQPERSCPLGCGVEETMEHFLVQCWGACRIWEEVASRLKIRRLKDLTYLERVYGVSPLCPEIHPETLYLIITTIKYYHWHTRTRTSMYREPFQHKEAADLIISELRWIRGRENRRLWHDVSL